MLEVEKDNELSELHAAVDGDIEDTTIPTHPYATVLAQSVFQDADGPLPRRLGRECRLGRAD